MATFGKTTIGGTAFDTGADFKHVNKRTLSERGTISKLSIYVDGSGAGSGSQVIRAVIYDDDADFGEPGMLLASGTTVTVTDGQAAGWVDLPLSATVTLEPGDYHLGFQAGNASTTIRRYTDAGVWRYFNADTFTDGASAPFGVPSGTDQDISLYATYEPPVGRSLAMPYTVIGQVGLSLATPYGIVAQVGRSIFFPYNVLVNVARSCALPYTVLVIVGLGLALPYSVRGAVGRSVAFNYLLHHRIGRSLVLLYSLGSEGSAFSHKDAGDSYGDGAVSPFGLSFPNPRVLSIFGTYTLPWVPERVPDFYTSRLGFRTAQRELAKAGPLPARTSVSLGWHGTSRDPERGSFALVRADGPLAHLLGERVLISTRAAGKPRSVIVYVHNESDLIEAMDLSLSRRAFMEVGLLSKLLIDGVVEVLA